MNTEGTATAQVAEIIRTSSRSGELITGDAIFHDLLNGHFLEEDGQAARKSFRAALDEALRKNDDLVALGADGEEPHNFFSSRFMTETYANMLMQKQSDLLLLIAQVVRENSAVYPRPVPLGAFLNSPFDLTEEEIGACLERIAADERYQDIRQTKTSLGTVFLYSTMHLEEGYASMLAEWIDVGQANNP